ncbi:hypothetical protein [Proteiniclasticum sp.]|uniref:hypothetical protein n=1 Tax=Proteiniclasticum sp. TaxID=2053595 RepID=UPI00289A1FEC|nr:hypothetical protein [Proteiniclasticum sp.]
MKKYLIITITLAMFFSMFGCDSNNEISLSPEQQISLSSEQQKAVNNSIDFIKNSEFASKDRIETNIITIKNADEKTWESVYSEDSIADKNAVDSTDWIITIGDRSGHDFAVIVCDSDTLEVIGYMPIQ